MVKILGAIVFVAGVIFFVGNVSRTFVTFPGLGWITMAIGGIMFRAGE